jgi:hypothetical protein
MTDAEFLGHCEQLCARHDAFGMVEFPLDDHERFTELAECFTSLTITKARVEATTRRDTLRRIRDGIVSAMRAELRK